MLALMCIAVVNVSSLWMEQADFSLEIEEAAHDTFNVNSNRSLFKLHCTRCLNFNHVLKTFVHDAIGLKASDILRYELHQVILQQKDLLREVTRFIARNFCP